MKKVFVILSIVLILFVSTVPCFALSSGFYNPDYINLGEIFYHYGDLTYTSHLPASLSVTFNSVNSESWRNSLSIFCNLTAGHTYFFYLDVPLNTVINFPQTSGGNFTLIPSSPYYVKRFDSLNNDYFLLTLMNPEVGVQYDFYNFYILDVSDIISNFSTDRQVYDYLSQFIDFSQPPSFPGVLHNRGFDNFTGFYGNLFHLFDPLFNFFDSWSFVTVFVFGILFILLMIFVIALVIRRCRNI